MLKTDGWAGMTWDWGPRNFVGYLYQNMSAMELVYLVIASGFIRGKIRNCRRQRSKIWARLWRSRLLPIVLGMCAEAIILEQ